MCLEAYAALLATIHVLDADPLPHETKRSELLAIGTEDTNEDIKTSLALLATQ